MADIATRVYNHTWKIDPIVRSVLDTDFYKLLMAQTIFRRHRDVQVTFGIKNRTDPRQACRYRRRGRVARAARPCPLAAADPGRIHLAARQHLLRQAPDVLAGVHGLARELPLPRIPSREGGRPICPHLRRTVDRDHDVGDPGSCHPQRAALPRRAQEHGQVRAAGPLCARHDARMGEDRAAQGTARTLDLRFRHASPARLPVAGLVRPGDDRRARCFLPRHVELPHRAAPRGGGGRHQRA